MSDVLDRLDERGYLTEPIRDALSAIDRGRRFDPRLARFADLDIPIPPSPGARPDQSPRAAALWLRAADLEDDVSVVVVGTGGRLLERAVRRLTDARVERVDDARDVVGTWDRILHLSETSDISGLDDHLDELGVLVFPRRDGDDLHVVRCVRSGGTTAEIVLQDARVVDDAYGPAGAADAEDGDLASLLELEASLVRAWTGNHLHRRERAWARSVDATWRPDPVGDVDPETWTLARRLFHCAYVLQMHGDLETAYDVYCGSLRAAESAEAYTFRGWTKSYLGDLDEAVADCRRAIDVDASLGNPYNDIGCYLLQQGDLDEAETWFERAKDATRYEAPHYPYLNLARLHLRRGDRDRALDAAQQSAQINPRDPATRELLRRLEDEES